MDTYFKYGGITLYAVAFQLLLLYVSSRYKVLQPQLILVWAIPASLVATKGISIDFCFPATEIFQFADLPPCA